jgi:exodeoxyribonuclease-3
MRLATWNVNSLKARLPRLEAWVEEWQPDILCLQETKVADADFPALALHGLGYDTCSWGTGRWNGVAVASRLGIERVVTGGSFSEEPRLVSAVCGPLRVGSVYVPNGRMVGTEHYEAKLRWLADLGNWLESLEPDVPVALCGDFNIAPDDRDVWDPAAAHGATHVSPPEREALRAILDRGFVDAFRLHHDDGGLFSWWDYRAGHFHKGYGMRIDLVLLSTSVAERCEMALIDRNARKGAQPSDHAPMIVDLDL